MSAQVQIGVVGCGVISGIYLEMLQTFEVLDVVACADIDLERAREKAARHGVERALTVADLLADPHIQIVVNLTPPAAHAEVALAALAAGKSVYNEKPLAVHLDDARQMLALAQAGGLRVGGAPDTFLGAGLQTCRRLIDQGAIGEPVAATAFMLSPGPETWHPSPDFYYQHGGGPLFDMGPYYLTALVDLLGPIRRVGGAARISFSERVIASQPRRGGVIRVRTPTHIVGTLEFARGPIGTLVTSFDVPRSELPHIEVYGSRGTLSLPDPNTFGGPVRLWRVDTRSWEQISLLEGWEENSRGLGVADLAHALQSGREHRASGDLAFHVLEAMHAILSSAESGQMQTLSSTCRRPVPLPEHLPPGRLDD